EFAAVYEARVRKHRGALTVFAIPNSLPYHRLGLSVPKRVGSAPVRNRVKRCLRESFRLLQHELPHHTPGTGDGGGFDFVIAVRPHERQPESEYRELLRTLATQLAGEWARRDRRSETDR
ncbi:MAG: ribonuclease P protein component, partial [Phycisphaerales bacterium]